MRLPLELWIHVTSHAPEWKGLAVRASRAVRCAVGVGHSIHVKHATTRALALDAQLDGVDQRSVAPALKTPKPRAPWRGHGWDEHMCASASRGHDRAVAWCARHGATKFDKAMRSAAATGQCATLRLLAFRYGAREWICAAFDAAEHGQLSAMRLCHRHGGAMSWDAPMALAASRGHTKAVRLCLRFGAKQRTRAAKSAAAHGHAATLELFSGDRRVDWNGVMASAAAGGCARCAQVCADQTTARRD